MPRSVNRQWLVPVLGLAGVLIVGAVAALGWGLLRPTAGVEPRAVAAYARGDWSETARLAHQWLRRNPDDPMALRLAARAAARQDRDDSAIAIYSRLVASNIESEDFYLMGRALSRTGQLERAQKVLESGRSSNPDDPATLDLLCRLYYQKDLYFAAEEAALRLATRPGWKARGQLMLGHARVELDDPAGVADALEKWLQLDPEGRMAAPDPLRPLQVLLARSLLQSGQPAKARRILEELRRSAPDSEVAWLLSRTFIQERDWTAATAAWKAASWFRAEHADVPEPAPYVGAARCAECHAKESRAVLASRHAATFFRPRDLKTLALPAAPLADPGNPDVTHEFRRDGDSLHLTTRTPARVFRAVIDYAFGSRDHFTTFVGRDDRDRPFMLRMSVRETKGGPAWHLATALPARPADEEEYLGKPIARGDGPRECLFCHTTSFRAARDETGPVATDHSIGCEKCHGSGSHHLAAVDAGFPDLAIACPSGTRPGQVHVVCGRCHGFPQAELAATPRTDPALCRFPSVTLTWSRCFLGSNGSLSCTTCHDPHHDAESSTSHNEARCLSCHATGSGPSTTSCPVNATGGCLECHMPRVWQQDSHTYKTDHFIRVRDRSRSKN
jgi:tetratricopeptide (TPR) repeat protein